MKKEFLTIKETSNILNISYATCRNWINLNNLESKTINGKTFILKSSIDSLLNDNINGRLSSRRNKTKKIGNILSLNYLTCKEDQHSLLTIINSIEGIDSIDKIKYILRLCSIALLKKAQKYDNVGKHLVDDLYTGPKHLDFDKLDFSSCSLNDDLLGALYMCLKRVSDRKNNGMYYTPTNVVDSMFKDIKKLCKSVKNKKIIDICCGTGNFLIKALENGFNYKNIYGRDYDLISIFLTRINLYLRCDASYDDLVNNIKFANSLMEEFSDYDFCVGNPPWGSKLTLNFNSIEGKFNVAKSKSIDSFCLFIEKGLKLLNKGGYLYYVCPESLCNVGIHESTRNYLMKNSKLIYLS